MDAYAALNQSVLFRNSDRRTLRGLAESAQWVSLPGGAYLYTVGDPGDALYILVSGRLRMTRPRLGATDELLSEIALGESVGEVAVITGQTRSTAAMAMRDSRLLRIDKAAFEQAMRRHPEAMLRVGRLIVQRLREDADTAARDNLSNARTYAVLPAHPGLETQAFAQALVGELAVAGSALRLDAPRVDNALGEQVAQTAFEQTAANSRLSLWLNRIEDRYRYLV